jgi:hypothetical protein
MNTIYAKIYLQKVIHARKNYEGRMNDTQLPVENGEL